MLSILITIPLALFGGWLVWRTGALLRRQKASWGWWLALAIVFLGGGYLGFRLGCLDLKVSPTFRWVGVPMPIVFFQLEGQNWTDFVLPTPIQWLNLLADVLIPVCILTGFLRLTWRLKRKGDPLPR